MTASRPTFQEHFMNLAVQASMRSTCSRLHVGAILVNPYWNLVGEGYNGAPSGEAHCVHEDDSPCAVAVHAEVNALLHASERRHCTMFVTHAPCYNCAGLMINAGIELVYYKELYRSLSGVDRLHSVGVSCVQLNL